MIIVMRKKIIISSILLLSIKTQVFADEICQGTLPVSPATKVENFSSKIAIITNKISTDDNSKLESASTYLSSISGSTNFNESDANEFINSITPVCENKSLEAKFRSKVCTRLAGLHGKVAQKLGVNGISNGKNAYNFLKLALSIDPNNTEAAIGHAVAVVGIYDQGFIIRKLAESKLNISANKEAIQAKEDLERLNLTTSSIYKRLLDVL